METYSEYNNPASGVARPCDTCKHRFVEDGGVLYEKNCMCKEYQNWFKSEWRAIQKVFKQEPQTKFVYNVL